MGMLVSAAEAAQLVGRHERVVRRRLARGDVAGAYKDVAGVWRIDVDALAGVAGWRVDRERLALVEAQQTRDTQRSPAGLVAQVEALRAQLRAVERRLAALEQRQAASPTATTGDTAAADASSASSASTWRSGGAQAADWYGDIGATLAPSDLALSASGDVLPDWGVSRATPRARVTLVDRGDGGPVTLRTTADAARFLSRHGVALNTARGWYSTEGAAGVLSARDWQTPGGVLAFAIAYGMTHPRAARANPLRACGDPQCPCAEVLLA